MALLMFLDLIIMIIYSCYKTVNNNNDDQSIWLSSINIYNADYFYFYRNKPPLNIADLYSR